MTARLEVRDLAKAFGAVTALSHVDLVANTGEVHAVIGENGAGKSTLMQILSGAEQADAGEIWLEGVPFRPRAPAAAQLAGVAIVHQEPMFCADLSVMENVLLGFEPTFGPLVDRRKTRQRAGDALSRIGARATFALETRMAELTPAERQLVAIARALAVTECRVLILDEPTSSITAADTARLFAVVSELARSGVTVLYISHFLEEIERVAQRYTVLRDGRSVASGAIADVTSSELATFMAGRQVSELFPRGPRSFGDVVLDVSELAGVRLPRRATLALRRGEVLGIAGLVGSGRSELLRAIFGLDAAMAGRVLLRGRSAPRSPPALLGAKVGLLSEDRQGEGLAGSLSIAENLTMSTARGLGPWPLVLPSRRRRVAEHWIEELHIRGRDPEQAASSLSGGNQQKVALARLLHHDVDIALLDEPTRGIDVGSRAEIYRLIDALASRGKAILLVSSYLPELLGVCDRIAVMVRGELGEARQVSELTEHAIMLEATG